MGSYDLFGVLTNGRHVEDSQHDRLQPAEDHDKQLRRHVRTDRAANVRAVVLHVELPGRVTLNRDQHRIPDRNDLERRLAVADHVPVQVVVLVNQPPARCLDQLVLDERTDPVHHPEINHNKVHVTRVRLVGWNQGHR
uniref:(northern house mosquito) hypothetical protein n=1 Tax=Culex pipiens TaxID=7175 RepID=A0A8D8B289_CULPI